MQTYYLIHVKSFVPIDQDLCDYALFPPPDLAFPADAVAYEIDHYMLGIPAQ